MLRIEKHDSLFRKPDRFSLDIYDRDLKLPIAFSVEEDFSYVCEKVSAYLARKR
jgi:hypothetical protein